MHLVSQPAWATSLPHSESKLIFFSHLNSAASSEILYNTYYHLGPPAWEVFLNHSPSSILLLLNRLFHQFDPKYAWLLHLLQWVINSSMHDVSVHKRTNTAKSTSLLRIYLEPKDKTSSLLDECSSLVSATNETLRSSWGATKIPCLQSEVSKNRSFWLNDLLASFATCYNWHSSCLDITCIFSRNGKKLRETEKKSSDSQLIFCSHGNDHFFLLCAHSCTS